MNEEGTVKLKRISVTLQTWKCKVNNVLVCITDNFIWIVFYQWAEIITILYNLFLKCHFIKIISVSQLLSMRIWFQSGLKFLSPHCSSNSPPMERGKNLKIHWNRFLVCMGEKSDLQRDIGLAQIPLESRLSFDFNGLWIKS